MITKSSVVRTTWICKEGISELDTTDNLARVDSFYRYGRRIISTHVYHYNIIENIRVISRII